MTDITHRASIGVRRDRLTDLAGKLAQFNRELSASASGVPMLIVTNRATPALSEHVLCCHDLDGSLAFFWPWGQRIADADQPATAAVAIGRVLG